MLQMPTFRMPMPTISLGIFVLSMALKRFGLIQKEVSEVVLFLLLLSD